MSQNAKSQEEFWYTIYQSLFLIPFLVSSSFNIMSLIVWKEGWGSTPTFLWECPLLTSTATLSHFFHSFLTRGSNYLMRVPVYPALTPPHAFLSLYKCGNISAWIFTCSVVPFNVSHGLTVCLSVWLTHQTSDWLTDRHCALFFLVKVKLQR